VASVEAKPFDLVFPVTVPAAIRSPVEVEISPRVLLLPRDRQTAPITVYVTRHTDEVLMGNIEILGPPGFVVQGSPSPVSMTTARYQDFQFRLRVPESLRPGVYNVHVTLGGEHVVLPVHKVDVRVPAGISVGLIRGVDDTAQEVLQAYVGERLEVLDAEKLALRPLEEFDTIVVDIRALRERPNSTTWRAARAAFPRLLEFCRRGGRLVVLYHKDTEFNSSSSGFVGSPYPLHLGKGRVTREDAPVEILRPEHILLTSPNRIQAEDWDGWVQERGLYFPDEYAPEYEEVIAMADLGQRKSKGALLFARHGAGEYVYCALSLYRQLDNLHPGACRLFANLISR